MSQKPLHLLDLPRELHLHIVARMDVLSRYILPTLCRYLHSLIRPLDLEELLETKHT